MRENYTVSFEDGESEKIIAKETCSEADLGTTIARMINEVGTFGDIHIEHYDDEDALAA